MEVDEEKVTKDNKRKTEARITPERFSSSSRNVALPAVKDEKRKPPGILANLAPKQVIVLPHHNERTSQDLIMKDENSPSNSSSSDKRLTNDQLKSKKQDISSTVPIVHTSKNHPIRRQWNKRNTTNVESLNESREKANEIKKAVIDREAEINAIKLKTLNESLEREQEKLMEQRRSISRERHTILNNKLNSSTSSNNIFNKAKSALNEKKLQEEIRSSKESSIQDDPRESEESFQYKLPFRSPTKCDKKSPIKDNVIYENSNSSKSNSYHNSGYRDQGPTRRRPTARDEPIHRSSSSESERRGQNNRGLTSNTGSIFTGYHPPLNTNIKTTSIGNPPIKTVVSNFTLNSKKSEKPNESDQNTNPFRRSKTLQTKKSWIDFINDKCSLPLILCVVIITTMVLIKVGHMAYQKFLEYDNVFYCPSNSTTSISLPVNATTKELDFFNKMKNCIKCPKNGECDPHGRLKCITGYKLIARECIENKVYNQMVDRYSEEFYIDYLYFKGDVECGLSANISYSEFVTNKIDSESKSIEDFLLKEKITNKEKFKDDIASSIKKRLDANSNYRMTLLCTIRNLIQENLILIIFVSIVLIFSTYHCSKFIKGNLNYLKAKEIYKQIENELKEGGEGDKNNFDFGLTENEIAQKYRKDKSESHFIQNIMPHLEKLRVKGRKIKKFNDRQQGKDVFKWQYLG